MLELQKFLKHHKDTWKQVLSASPYNLKIKEKDNLVLFKYSQFDSDFSLPLVQEARGIILERDTWNVVSIAFNKFFNLGEPNAAQIDWYSAIGTEKLDGSLMTVYFYDGQWKVKTNGTIDATDAELDSPLYKNFRELFDAAAENSGLDYSRLDKRKSYTFELCSKYNKVVLQYDEPELYHILTRWNVEPFDEIKEGIGVKKPWSICFFSKESYEDFVRRMNKSVVLHEGIVVRDKYANRVKIKTEQWLSLHYLIDEHNTSEDRLIEMVLANDTDELLSYFPEYETTLEHIQMRLHAIEQQTRIFHLFISNQFANKTRKEIALSMQSNSWDKTGQALFWLIYDNKISDDIHTWDLKLVLKIYYGLFGKGEN